MLPLLIIQHGLGLYYRLHLALVRMTKTLSVTETNSGNANYDSSFGGSDFAVTSSGRAVTNKGVTGDKTDKSLKLYRVNKNLTLTTTTIN